MLFRECSIILRVFLTLYISGHLSVAANFLGAYFHTMLGEWCWVFMDGIWSICLGFTLPLSRAASKLAPSRPTSSLLGPHTMSSAMGVLLINYFFFILIALGVLFGQDWFQCRKWDGDDISNVLTIGDNYETTTIFVVLGFQFISSAMSFNFGYEFRGSWLSNTWFIFVIVLFSTLHFFVTLVPSSISCIFRVNCNNEDVVPSVSVWKDFPIQNPFHTTEMPVSYRFTLLVIVALNTAAVLVWEYYVVNGTRQRLARKKREKPTKGFAIADDLVLEAETV